MTGAGRASFSGHETFPFRYTWLKKAVDAADGDEYAFHADEGTPAMEHETTRASDLG